MSAWLARVFGQERDTHLLGLVRIAICVLLLAHLRRLIGEYLDDGYFGDVFHQPIVPEALVPSRAVYASWLALQVLAAVLALLGVRAREGVLFVSGSCLYVLACDRLQYHNNRYALLLLGFLLAFTPCDRSFVCVGGGTREGGERGPVWARRLMQLQVSLIYLASSGGKLLDRDWREGQVMLVRGVHGLRQWSRMGWHVPGFVVDVLSSPLLINIASKAGIATEMFIAIGLWRPRARPYALWLGVMFHLGIELSAHVELFSWLMWSSYVLFATPECRERVLRYRTDLPAARRLARAVRALDWLARLRIEAAESSEPALGGTAPALRGGASFCVIDRDGSSASGMRGFAGLARTLPLLFPLWLPLHLLTLRTASPGVRTVSP